MKRFFSAFILALTLCGAVHAADCQKSLSTIFSNEGGFQRLRSDSGNWTGGKIGKGKLIGTKFGICAASYPKVDIPNLTLPVAARYYERDYFNPLQLPGIKSQGLATTILDTAVNCGVGTAAILVERTCNMLNGTGPDSALNARITPDMVRWINAYTKPREQRVLFYYVFQSLRSERYVAIARKDRNKRQFLDDWLIRTWD
jgi:hypothetical protein